MSFGLVRAGMVGAILSVALLGLVSGCSRLLDAESARLFEEAEKTFAAARSAEDYLRSAAMYQEILDRGQVSGAVLYNQGNAFMQAGQRGRAIAAYRQARRYLGRDPLLEANLAYALGSTPAVQRRPLVEHLLFWQDWLSYPDKFSLAAAGVGTTFLLAVAALFVRRRWLARLAILGVAVSLLLVFSAGYDWYRYDSKTRGVIVAKQTVVRKGNAESYEPALTAPVDEGMEFDLIERRGDWLRIRLAGVQEDGWIPDRAAVCY